MNEPVEKEVSESPEELTIDEAFPTASNDVDGIIGESFEKNEIDPVDEGNEEFIGDMEASEGAVEETKTCPDGDDPTEIGTKQAQEPLKRDKNASFKDVEKTGMWGKISKVEFFIVLLSVVAIVIAVVVVAVVLTLRASASSDTLAPTAAPTILSVEKDRFVSVEQKYGALLDILGSNTFTSEYVELLPASYGELKVTPIIPGTTDPVVRAAKWVIEEDSNSVVSYLSDRFALAALFYFTNGEGWFDNANWLSNENVCSWARITCVGYGAQTLDELDLSSNNLVGELPNALALLSTVGVLWFNDNELGGSIPGGILGSLPRLFILYLQDNYFIGAIPESLLDSGTLRKLVVLV